MATALYDKGREAFATGLINWVSDDIRVIFIDSADYSVNLSTHDYLNDIPSGARVATMSASLANKTATNGVCDADDATLVSVTGDQFEALVIYKHTGTESTSALIAYIDNYSNLPCTPTGTSITITWPSDSNKIFKL